MPIMGLQVDVKSAELKKIISSRVEYHQNKAEAYEAQAGKLRATIKGIEEDNEVGKVTNSNGDPAQNMETKAKEHKDKAVHFQFLLDHVIVDETYRLSTEDLRMLGIATARFY